MGKSWEWPKVDTAGLDMAAMFNGITFTEPAGIILASIMAYKRAYFKLPTTEINLITH